MTTEERGASNAPAHPSGLAEKLGVKSITRQAPILLLALGNDLLGDDAVGLLAARELRKHFDVNLVDIVESGEAGFALLEQMEGYEKALLLDSVQTGESPPGTILEFGVEDFRTVVAPSPHYAGLPEILELAKRLKIVFPTVVKVVGLEIEDKVKFQTHLTEKVEAAFPELVERTKKVIQGWIEGEGEHA